ncbi:MAG: pyruvate carboxylase [Eubacterium sp.]|nr:pyruvate carboxylase [Eubacterium sp.]
MDVEVKKFKKVLVANRGEIAIRIFRALSELGIGSVAIYSKEDRYALFRTKADEAYPLNPDKGPVDAYLDIPTIIRIAKEKKVDAIHPGYGFLSENPEFAQACRKNDIVFIGPNVQAMKIMGDKISAKRAAFESKVPIIEGSDFILNDVETAKKVAAEIGYPVMLKASNGGGGRGMHIVEKEEDMEKAFEKSRNESKRVFGEAKLFLEKYLIHPKHIEVQILGDNYGNIVHLYDRDCSLQRRNQKVIEFAPAWSVSEETRKIILDSAKRLARRVGYTNAGTMEFLVDEENHPYFIEMNPRIQVEHTVSEEITGIDIVICQILIAQGYPLNSPVIHIYSQNEVKCNGYAIEVRVTTEDPASNFLPDTGKIDLYRSGCGSGIRLDGGCDYTGAVITSHYDSLLVKVISHDRTFEKAIRKSVRALKEMRIHGVKTNLIFLINVLNHDLFHKGKCFTTFIEETPELSQSHYKLDRTTKILEFLANKMVNVNPGPKPFFEDRRVPVIDMNKKIYGTRDEFLRLGPEEFTRKIYRSKKLYVTDTTMRDGQQSLLATRMRTKEIAGAARATNLYLKDSYSVEAWGGATYDTEYRFLKESPWKRLDLLRERMPNVMIQMLLRASNVVGYHTYPDNVIKKFIKVSSDHGVDIYRIFDSMNWIENMKLPVEEALKTGKIVEGAICYTGDILNPKETKYTVDYYCRKARELESLGCHVIALKDMSGILKPYAAKKLITALKEEVHVPVHLHTHDTTGNGVATYLMAAEAGVDIVDCAIGSMSSLTSQPSLNALVEALRGTERDTGIDPEGLLVLNEYYEHERKVYKSFESDMDSPNPEIYKYEIPGGQYSNFAAQVEEMGAASSFHEVKKLYKEADELLGNIIKVTPTSKVVGDLAIFMQKNELTKENILEKGKDLSYPESVVSYFRGDLGQPEGGFPKELQKIVLKGQEPITVRPGSLLPDADFEQIGRYLRENYYMESMEQPEVMEQKVLSYALYPKVYEDYCEHFQAYNDVSKLESHVYFYGLRPGEETTIQIEEGNDTLIKFIRKTDPDENGYRILQFEVNGFLREVKILDKHFEVKADRKLKTDHNNPGHLGASLPGTICDIQIHEGDHVTKNMPLMVIEAMKMETTVTSRVNGTVDKIYVKNGEDVNEDTLLVSFIIDEKDQIPGSHPKLPEMDITTLENDEFKTVTLKESEESRYGKRIQDTK